MIVIIAVACALRWQYYLAIKYALWFMFETRQDETNEVIFGIVRRVQFFWIDKNLEESAEVVDKVGLTDDEKHNHYICLDARNYARSIASSRNVQIDKCRKSGKL